MPTREQVRRFIEDSPGRVGRREIARAFGLGPEHGNGLRGILRSLAGAGEVAPGGKRQVRSLATRDDTAIVVVTGTDRDGDAIARPVAWRGEGPPPTVFMQPEPPGNAALAPGERVLARLRPIGTGRLEGRTVKRVSDTPPRILGAFRRDGEAGRLVPTDRRAKAEWLIPAGATLGAEQDDIVLAEPVASARGRAHGLRSARVVERLGRLGEARSVSLIAIATHGIPDAFATDALEEAARALPAPLDRRDDLRHVPLVTIDGADARDFDDAVFAEPDGDGYRLVVAIADVAHFVRPGSALDREARRRGNSCYFPDRVVPMLPEALSAGLCSLRPGEDRACLFVEMRIDRDGDKRGYRFGRGLMRSAARLTYEAMQARRDREVADDDGDGAGDPDLPPGLVGSLYGAFAALLGARLRRGTLDLDLPERKVVLDAEGRVAAVAPRPRLDSHRLIEEFMVLANVSAAEELERRRAPAIFRVHAPPSPEKLDALRDFLSTLGIPLRPAGEIRPADLDAVLRRVAGTDAGPQVNEVVLRSQSQAEYSPDNRGHFGLALRAYAHFTSPIRRYADLEIHRALIGALGLGPGGLAAGEADGFEAVAEAVTATERRAALAERDATDRYLAAFMADKVGATFAGRISGVTRFGLFVTLLESGANGLLPARSLPDDDWMHDELSQALVGRRSRIAFGLTDPIEVVLAEADALTGTLVFAPAGTRPHRRPGVAGGSGARRRPGR